MNSALAAVAGILGTLSPDVLAALGRILTLASKLDAGAAKSFVEAIGDALSPERAIEVAAKAISIELDVLQLRADVALVQLAITTAEAERVGRTIGDLA